MCKVSLRFTVLLFAIFGGLIITIPAAAQTIESPFDTNYTFTDLGAPPEVPPNLGGLTFKADDPNTLLIGGSAANTNADIFSIGVTRDAGNHITGFTGTATFFSDANGVSGGGGIDGGLMFGPGGVLFYTSFSDNRLGQIKPGSTGPDKLIDLSDPAIGIASSVGTLAFVPMGFPGAGKFKIAQFSGDGNWYDVTLTPDGLGTFDITAAVLEVAIGGGPEGIVYIAAGNPQFSTDSVLVSEFSFGRVSAYEIDANGDPIVATRRDFMTGLSGAEGAVIDPLTGDFLFSTFGGGNRVIVVQGFLPPLALDHFLCYKAKTTPGTEKFLPVPGVTLTDQFDTEVVEVKKSVSLCNPADKNGGGIADPDTHLKGYQIKPATAHVPVTGIIVKNQFHPDGLSFDTIKPDRLLVPTLKDLDNPVTLPDPFEPNVDHFKCYKVKVTKGTAKFPKGIQATVVDQFNQPKLYDIKKPTRLCAPVLDKEHPPGTHTLAKNPDVHLMCYQAKPASGQPKHIPVKGIFVNNQFGAEQLDTIKEEELCVPSVKILP